MVEIKIASDDGYNSLSTVCVMYTVYTFCAWYFISYLSQSTKTRMGHRIGKDTLAVNE